MKPCVEASGLRLRYPGGPEVLAGVDLSVRTGEVVALVGSNGSGKSTLLRALIRLQEPDSGTVRICDQDVTRADRRQLRAIRRGVGFVFQRLNLVPRLTVFTNVTLGAVADVGSRAFLSSLAPRDLRDRAMAALEQVQLTDLAARPVRTLSGGQQQRVAIARMILQAPRVVLADEPVASLDPRSGRVVLDLLRGIARDDGLTVVMALHQLPYAREYADRALGLRGGRIVLDTPAHALQHDTHGSLYDQIASA